MRYAYIPYIHTVCLSMKTEPLFLHRHTSYHRGTGYERRDTAQNASPLYLGDFDLKRRHKNECYLVSASRTYLERSFGPHNSAGVRVG